VGTGGVGGGGRRAPVEEKGIGLQRKIQEVTHGKFNWQKGGGNLIRAEEKQKPMQHRVAVCNEGSGKDRARPKHVKNKKQICRVLSTSRGGNGKVRGERRKSRRDEKPAEFRG